MADDKSQIVRRCIRASLPISPDGIGGYEHTIFDDIRDVIFFQIRLDIRFDIGLEFCSRSEKNFSPRSPMAVGACRSLCLYPRRIISGIS